MTSSDSVANGTRVRSPWWLINALGLYVLLMYGIAYYAISTAAPRMAADFGVAPSSILGLFSSALLLTAPLAPLYGRWMDRFGAGMVLLLGSLARVGALIAMAIASDLAVFIAALLAVQLLSQATEYDATFAAAVDIAGPHARAAMSQITLWGGLASTAFWPLTAMLLERGSWRTMLLIYAAVMLVVCTPIALMLMRRPRERTHAAIQQAPTPSDSTTGADAGQRAPSMLTFVLLATAFGLGGIAFSLPVLMLPVLDGLGLGASAILAGALFGPAQTAGRFAELLFGRRMHALRVAMLAMIAVVLSLVILGVAGTTVTGAIAFAVLFGAGVGVGYVTRGSVVLALYGTRDYATWLGRLGATRLVVSAAAPYALALVLEQAGAASVVTVCAATAALSVVCFAALARYLLSFRTTLPSKSLSHAD